MRLLVIICFYLEFFGQAEAQLLVTPADLRPSLTFVRQELEAQIKKAKSQDTVFLLYHRLQEVTEAELFFAYVRLSERGSPAARMALRRDEARWDETYRDYVGSHIIFSDDIAAVLEGRRAIIHCIDLRTETLHQRLSYLQRHASGLITRSSEPALRSAR